MFVPVTVIMFSQYFYFVILLIRLTAGSWSNWQIRYIDMDEAEMDTLNDSTKLCMIQKGLCSLHRYGQSNEFNMPNTQCYHTLDSHPNYQCASLTHCSIHICSWSTQTRPMFLLNILDPNFSVNSSQQDSMERITLNLDPLPLVGSRLVTKTFITYLAAARPQPKTNSSPPLALIISLVVSFVCLVAIVVFVLRCYPDRVRRLVEFVRYPTRTVPVVRLEASEINID